MSLEAGHHGADLGRAEAPIEVPIAPAGVIAGAGPEGLDRLTSALYRELRRLASRRLRGERAGHTLGTTALVHEAYLRLASQRRLGDGDRDPFLAAASTMMRRVLIDYARTRRRAKRGGDAVAVPIDEAPPLLSDRACDEMLELDQALGRLTAARPRAAWIFEQRVFGGRCLTELSEALGLSSKTVQRDWDAARAWLRKEVRRGLADTAAGGAAGPESEPRTASAAGG